MQNQLLKFNQQFVYINYSLPEDNSGEILTETAGYVSNQKKIESMILAGQRLDESRNYDFMENDEIDEQFYDPTRNKYYDAADAFQDGLKVEYRLKKQQLDNEALKASQAAQETRSGLSEDIYDPNIKQSYKKAIEP